MSEITLNELKSGNIKAVGYDEDSKTLAVEFTAGGTYHYKDFPKKEFDIFMKAKSFGGYFHHNIRGRYAADLQPAKKEKK